MTQRSRANLETQIGLLVNTNGLGEITAADVRSVLDDVADSCYNLTTDSLSTLGAVSSTLTNGYILVGNPSNVATGVAQSGDVTFSNAGVSSIGSGKVTNAMLAGSIDLASKVTGILPAANGGAGAVNGILKANGSGAVSVAVAGTDFCGVTSGSSVLKASSGSTTAATAGTDYVAPGTVTAFTAQQNFAVATITSTSNSIAWNLNSAQVAKHTATEATTLANPTNMVAGGTYIFRWTQHASSPKTLAFGNAYKWPGGSVPVVTASNSAVDMFSFYSDGTNMYGVFQGNFS